MSDSVVAKKMALRMLVLCKECVGGFKRAGYGEPRTERCDHPYVKWLVDTARADGVREERERNQEVLRYSDWIRGGMRGPRPPRPRTPEPTPRVETPDRRLDDGWTECGRCGAHFPTASTCSNHRERRCGRDCPGCVDCS